MRSTEVQNRAPDDPAFQLCLMAPDASTGQGDRPDCGHNDSSDYGEMALSQACPQAHPPSQAPHRRCTHSYRPFPIPHQSNNKKPRSWSRANPDGYKATTAYRWAQSTILANNKGGKCGGRFLGKDSLQRDHRKCPLPRTSGHPPVAVVTGTHLSTTSTASPRARLTR